MKVYIGQIYIETNAIYNFSHLFQRYIHEQLTRLVDPSPLFISKYGQRDLKFNMSAKSYNVETKKKRKTNQIKGPTIVQEINNVEYSIFLPYDHKIEAELDRHEFALVHLFDGIREVLGRYEIDTAAFSNTEHDIIRKILSSPEMIDEPEEWW